MQLKLLLSWLLHRGNEPRLSRWAKWKGLGKKRLQAERFDVFLPATNEDQKEVARSDEHPSS